MQPTEKDIEKALRTVKDPELHLDLVVRGSCMTSKWMVPA